MPGKIILKTNYSGNGQMHTWVYGSLLLRLRSGPKGRMKEKRMKGDGELRGKKRTP